MSENKSDNRRLNRKRAQKQKKQRNVAVVAAAVVAAIALVVIALSQSDTEVAAPSANARLAHVHGLGVDTSNGKLYAGTHYGVFRLDDDGKAAQIGPVRDYMGFTVVGPDHFLASGHPGVGESGPSALGLIESTDGGKTWKTLSLEGKADFHALAERDGRIYGFNAGTLMVSDDGRNWDTRASLGIRDLAISPKSVDTVAATTQSGLALSTDAGRSFTPVTGSPPLVLVAWPVAETLVGVSADGAVQASGDGGRTWEQRGSVSGVPEALTATADRVFVATSEGILESTDGGRTFQLRFRSGG